MGRGYTVALETCDEPAGPFGAVWETQTYRHCWGRDTLDTLVGLLMLTADGDDEDADPPPPASGRGLALHRCGRGQGPQGTNAVS